jgi:hypothetical protein
MTMKKANDKTENLHGTMTMDGELKYDKTYSLVYDNEQGTWKIGPYTATIVMSPAFHGNINSIKNINSLSIAVINRAPTDGSKEFSIGFDSVGMAEDGKCILYEKFSDACDQLDKNKVNVEKFLKANIDLSAIRGLKPMEMEFENRASGRTVGNNELTFD